MLWVPHYKVSITFMVIELFLSHGNQFVIFSTSIYKIQRLLHKMTQVYPPKLLAPLIFYNSYRSTTYWLPNLLQYYIGWLTPRTLELCNLNSQENYFSYHFISFVLVVSLCILFLNPCLLYTSPSPRDGLLSRMPSSA